MNSGSDEQRTYISGIIPLVSRHHLLLVTLLLANAAGKTFSERGNYVPRNNNQELGIRNEITL
jgi:hypothetical protein